MKRTIVLLVGCLLSFPSSAQAQSTAEIIERALSPLPRWMARQAAVIRWNADYTWETLKEGTNQWVCYDRSGERYRARFVVQCTNVGNLPRVAQNRRFDMESSSRDEVREMVAAAAANGTRVDAVYGSMWIRLYGNDRETAGFLTTIAVPYATSESTGLPDNNRAGGAWVMAAGTSEAHIMLPGR